MQRSLPMLVALLLTPFLAAASRAAQPVAQLAGGPPFTETMADMVRRDLQWQWEVEHGLRPRPPRLMVIPEHRGEEFMRERGEEPDVAFVPAVFLPPERDRAAGPSGQRRYILSPQAKGASFAGVSLQDQYSRGAGWIPPDTCGAIGPDHFLEVINGSVAVYTRTGSRLSYVSLNSFFAVNVGGTSYPRGFTFDPRVLYDRRSGRFFATALEYNSGDNNQLLLAVSRTSNPTGTWDKYVLTVGQSGHFTDYDTLGVDDNGVYMAVTLFTSTDAFEVMAVTRKGSLVGSPPSLGTVYLFEEHEAFYATPQPALNLDAVPSDGPAWFVASSNYTFSNMMAAYLTWPASGAPTLSSVMVLSLPGFAFPPTAPAKGSTTNIDSGDMRMQPAMIRANRLYTCRTIGVNSTGGGSGADRTAVEWIELDVSTSTPSVVQSGRLYDGALTDPVFFYYGSVAVNGPGQLAVAFSDSNGNRWVAAETAGRLSIDPPDTLQSVMEIVPGQNKYTLTWGGSRNRWGDYSYTSVDPNDDLSIWTIQEYATASENIWGTWICQLLAPAPTLDNPGGTGRVGTTGNVLTLTGTNLFDPGPGFRNHLQVQLTGGTVNGISNYVVTYLGPTSVQVQFDIALNASGGPRTIVLTNPDGQQAIVPDGFTVEASVPTTLQVANIAGGLGATVGLQATLTRTDNSAPVAGKAVAFSVAGTGVGNRTTDASGVATLDYVIPMAMGTGTFSIDASFAGDAPYEPSSGSGTLTVTKADTVLAVDNVSGAFTAGVTLGAVLTRATDHTPLDGRLVSFSIEGTAVGDGTTSAAGRAEVPYTIPEALGRGGKTVQADYAGDADHNAGTGTGTLTVIGWPTALSVSDAAGMVSQTVTLSAHLQRSDTSAPLDGRTVSFTVAGTAAGSGTTNASGDVSLSYAIPDTLGSGALALAAHFAGDTAHEPSDGSATLTVTKAPTSLYVPDRTGTMTEVVTLRGYLRRTTDNAWVAGRTVAFSIDGTAVGSGVTGSDGRADYNWVITGGATTRSIGAQFAGDGVYTGSSGSGTLTCQSWGTKMATFDRTARITDRTELKCRLLRSDNVPLYNKSINFYVDGTFVIARPTNTQGYASYPYYDVPEGAGAGTRTILSEWVGNAGYAPISKTATLTVLKALPYIWVLPKSVPQGAIANLYAYFRRLYDYKKQEGKPVTFRIDGTWIADVVTGSGTSEPGVARYYYNTSGLSKGTHTIRCEFAGDAWVEAGYGQGTLNIY